MKFGVSSNDRGWMVNQWHPLSLLFYDVQEEGDYVAHFLLPFRPRSNASVFVNGEKPLTASIQISVITGFCETAFFNCRKRFVSPCSRGSHAHISSARGSFTFLSYHSSQVFLSCTLHGNLVSPCISCLSLAPAKNNHVVTRRISTYTAH